MLAKSYFHTISMHLLAIHGIILSYLKWSSVIQFYFSKWNEKFYFAKSCVHLISACLRKNIFSKTHVLSSTAMHGWWVWFLKVKLFLRVHTPCTHFHYFNSKQRIKTYNSIMYILYIFAITTWFLLLFNSHIMILPEKLL